MVDILHCEDAVKSLTVNNHTFPVLRLLSDGDFHSGQTLGEQLGISRAAVWNAIKEAQELGVEIHSVHGKGYRLSSAIDFLDADRINHALNSTARNFTLELLETTTSTNSDLMKRAAADAPQGTCIAAELQQAGRGRRGRAWVSSLGSGLTFSLLWRFSQGAVALGGLSLAVGVALVRALSEVGITQLALKWPNDVLHADKKLAGTLIELQGEMLGPTAAVIGIGLNIKLPDEVKTGIDQPVADLTEAGNLQAPPRNELLAVLLRHLYDVLSEFEQQGFTALRDEWQQHHAHHGKLAQLTLPNGLLKTGIVNGIDADGALLVNVGGQVQRFSTAEISLRSPA